MPRGDASPLRAREENPLLMSCVGDTTIAEHVLHKIVESCGAHVQSGERSKAQR